MKIEKINLSYNTDYAKTISSESVLNIKGASLIANKINKLIDVFNQFNKQQDLLIDCILHSKKKEPEILNCAWCDTPAICLEFYNTNKFSVICSNKLDCRVRAETKLFDTEREAISAWNTRGKK